MTMTREEKLYSMRMQDLKAVADKLGIKINTKAAKSIAVEKILEAEANWEDPKKDTSKEDKVAEENFNNKNKKVLTNTPVVKDQLVPMPGSEKLADLKAEVTDKATPKRGALITYKGKAQNICAWAKELGKSANTLYGRIYKLGWSVEDAFEK